MSGRLVYCAFDSDDLDAALAWANALAGIDGLGVKIGKQFFTAHGPAGVRAVIARCGLPLFLDLKFHDIPNTVAGAVRAALTLRPRLLNVHAGGGPAMLRAAVGAAQSGAAGDGPAPLVIAVTVLTSLVDDDLAAIGMAGPTGERARALARLAQDQGCDGAVCSPLDIAAIREACGPEFRLVVPGIRPGAIAGDDQKRTLGPCQARALGADDLVIGRPITQSPDPAVRARAILSDLAA